MRIIEEKKNSKIEIIYYNKKFNWGQNLMSLISEIMSNLKKIIYFNKKFFIKIIKLFLLLFFYEFVFG